MKRKNKVGVKKKEYSENVPNALTAKVIEDAHKGIGLGKPIKDIDKFTKSI